VHPAKKGFCEIFGVVRFSGCAFLCSRPGKHCSRIVRDPRSWLTITNLTIRSVADDDARSPGLVGFFVLALPEITNVSTILRNGKLACIRDALGSPNYFGEFS
jgi:hypothetical protein